MIVGYTGERFTLLIKQGSSFLADGAVTTSDLITPYDLTNATLSAIIKKSPNTATVTATLAVGIVDAVNGKYTLSLDPSTTAALICGDTKDDPKSKYLWELIMTETSGRVSPLADGDVYVYRKLSN